MKNLVKLRTLKGLTQSELGEKIDCDGNTISRYERGIIKPSIETAQKLASFFGVTVDELLNGEAKGEIEIRIVIRESDDEVGNVTMDMSKNAPFLRLVEISPHKTGLNVVFGQDVSLRDVCGKLLEEEDKLEAARAAIYGG